MMDLFSALLDENFLTVDNVDNSTFWPGDFDGHAHVSHEAEAACVRQHVSDLGPHDGLAFPSRAAQHSDKPPLQAGGHSQVPAIASETESKQAVSLAKARARNRRAQQRHREKAKVRVCFSASRH
jgi:hypothetical protein